MVLCDVTARSRHRGICRHADMATKPQVYSREQHPNTTSFTLRCNKIPTFWLNLIFPFNFQLSIILLNVSNPSGRRTQSKK
jgi:hypothetical protein